MTDDRTVEAVIRLALDHAEHPGMCEGTDGMVEPGRSAAVARYLTGPHSGYVVLPRKLLDELVDAWTNDGSITRCDNAAQALVAAVVEAVGPTREDTE